MRIPVFPQVAEAYRQSAAGRTTGEPDKTGCWSASVIREFLIVAALVAPPGPVLNPFQPPATAYGRGHRGVDFAVAVGQPVVAPIDGVVSFAGRINDRGVVSIRNGSMLVSLEPIDATVRLGEPVAVGQRIGVTGNGGHCALRCIHLGLRINGVYSDPLMSQRRLLRYAGGAM